MQVFALPNPLSHPKPEPREAPFERFLFFALADSVLVIEG
jgi:hypothetical protein